MAQMNDSFVPITLADVEKQLVATPKAMLAVSRLKGGFKAIYEGIDNFDIDTYIAILRIGLSQKNSRVLRDEDVAEMIYKSGGPNVIATDILKYVFMLQTGGRSLDDEPEAADEDETEGNG